MSSFPTYFFIFCVFAGCGRDHSETKESEGPTPETSTPPDTSDFASSAATGKIAGSSWKFVEGILQKSEEGARVTLSPLKNSLTCENVYYLTDTASRAVSFDLTEIAAKKFTYPNAANQYIRVNPSDADTGTRLATSGSVSITNISENASVKGKITFKYDDNNHVNGPFTAKICP